MSTILLTNDDGIQAPGLLALEKSLSSLGELCVIAPHVERSASGRSVTLDKPLRVKELSRRRFAVDGTPADCVLLAFRSLVSPPPNVVVSGINNGYNVGEDLDYSGTVGAAAEGALQGAKVSIAVSIDKQSNSLVLDPAADFIRNLIQKFIEVGLPAGSFLNVNFPRGQFGTLRWTRQAEFLGRGDVEIGTDPRGEKYYWIAERPEENNSSEDSDRAAVQAGYVSISLLTLDRNWKGEWTPPEL